MSPPGSRTRAERRERVGQRGPVNGASDHREETTCDHRRAQGDQDRRAARRAHPRRRPRPRRPRPPGAHRARSRDGQRLPRRGLHEGGGEPRAGRRGVGPGGADPEGQGAHPGRVPPPPLEADPVHLPSSGRRARPHASAPEIGDHRDRIRDGAARRREPAAPHADERGGGPAVGAGRRLPPGQGARRARHPALGRPRRAAGQRRDSRRRHGRPERGSGWRSAWAATCRSWT